MAQTPNASLQLEQLQQAVLNLTASVDRLTEGLDSQARRLKEAELRWTGRWNDHVSDALVVTKAVDTIRQSQTLIATATVAIGRTFLDSASPPGELCEVIKRIEESFIPSNGSAPRRSPHPTL